MSVIATATNNKDAAKKMHGLSSSLDNPQKLSVTLHGTLQERGSKELVFAYQGLPVIELGSTWTKVRLEDDNSIIEVRPTCSGGEFRIHLEE